jgi:toxin ParE1/3/4
MALKLRLDPQAAKDVQSIRAYLLAEAGPKVAERVRNHLLKRMESLRDNPTLGVTTTEPDIRVLPPTRYPYRIYYTTMREAVVVLHVRHSARRDPDFKYFTQMT